MKIMKVSDGNFFEDLEEYFKEGGITPIFGVTEINPLNFKICLYLKSEHTDRLIECFRGYGYNDSKNPVVFYSGVGKTLTEALDELIYKVELAFVALQESLSICYTNEDLNKLYEILKSKKEFKSKELNKFSCIDV